MSQDQNDTSFLDTFEVFRGDSVSIVGSGGKVTLMYQLAKEAVALNYSVLTTASTHIHPPNAKQSAGLVVTSEEPDWLTDLPDTLAERGHMTVVGARPRPDKLRGLTIDALDELRTECPTDLLLIKSDGARTKVFKAPAEHEPVVPPWVTHCIIVAGLQSVGLTLTEENVHRSERVSELSGLKMKAKLTPAAIGTVVSHPEAYLRRIHEDINVSVYLGWCSDDERRQMAEEVAEHIDMTRISAVYCGAIDESDATLTLLR